MSSEQDLERAVRAWLSDGRESLPDRYLDAALDEVSTTNQRRRGASAWRPSEMNMFARYGLAAAAALLVAILGWTVIFNGSHVSNPRPTPSPVPSASPSGQTDLVHLSDTGFAVPLTYEAPASWTSGPGGTYVTRLETNPHWGVSWYSGVRLQADPCHPSHGFVTPAPGPTPEDLAAALKTIPGLTVSDPVAYSSPGHSGVMVQFRYTGPSSGCESTNGFDVQVMQADRSVKDVINASYELRWYITEVHGTRIVIEAWSGGTPLAGEMSELGRIIDSITFQ